MFTSLSLNILLRCILSGLSVNLEQLAVIHPHKSSKFELLAFFKKVWFVQAK